MKKHRIKKVVTFFLAGLVLTTGISYMPVEAGSSDIVVDSATYAEGLDGSAWNNPDGDIQIKDGTIIFDKNSTSDTRLITKNAVKATKEIKELVKVNAKLQFTALPEGETFSLSFGVKKIEAYQGDDGNIEIGFTNQGGLSASITYFNEDGEAEVLKKATKCGSLQGQNLVEATIGTDKVLKVAVNGKEICNLELPVSGEGRIGFLQTGSCGVHLRDIKIVSHLYDSPENCNIDEDFEAGGFNANLLTSKMRGASYVCWPSGTKIDDCEGSKAFIYTNAGECYIGTKYTYSNFEMTFDVPYLQRGNILDEGGNIVTAGSNRFGISYGGAASDFDYAGYTDGVTDVIWFNSNSTLSPMKKEEMVDLAALGYPIFSKECKKGFSVKVAMNDSVVSVFLKWLDEKEYKEVYKYQLSTSTPTGYLHIWADGPTNMAIDNLKIRNTDINPQLVEVEFKTSAMEQPKDYDYQPMEKVYAPEKEKEGFNVYLILPFVGAACILGLGTVVAITAMKNKKRKVGEKHEIQ